MNHQNPKQEAKLPDPETGIEIHKSICDICTPGSHCGLDVYVRDGKIVKVTGAAEFPSRGRLCVKGTCTREYVYREDRIRTPLLRTGPRGSGQFREASWEEAYAVIADRLKAVRSADGPDATAWFVGYEKWNRAWVQRLAYDFGSVNFGTESSVCFFATAMAGLAMTGAGMLRPDLEHTDLYLGWGANPYMSSYQQVEKLEALKARGGRIIIIDPRVTPTTQRLADLHLQLRPGTDGALALGLANLLIEQGNIDHAYIQAHVTGFEAFRELAARYTPEETEMVTGIPADQLRLAAEWIAGAASVCSYLPPAAVTHHTNGFNNMRAILSLLAITGNIDVTGGQIPGKDTYAHMGAGFSTMEHAFISEHRPADLSRRVGADRFPLWAALSDEMQAVDLARQIREGAPYPIKALVAFGMNHRMFPEPRKMLEAFSNLEFLVAVDLFQTETCQWADVVLPACSSLERSELKAYPFGLLTCTTPAIQPLYQSKNDAQIVCELAQALDVDDDLLKSGYDATMAYMISNLSVTLEQLREAGTPVRVQELCPYRTGTFLEHGFPTPSAKIELCPSKIAAAGNLDPLPAFYETEASLPSEEYPFRLITGARMAHVIHSRFHKVPAARALRPDPAVDLHPDDAQTLGISEGDPVRIQGEQGEISVKAHLTDTIRPGDLYLYHGYEEADANTLVPESHLDPYTGFPGYRAIRCRLVR